MTLIRELFSRKPKTQAELDAFNERNRIDLQWRHHKQVYKELKAYHKQEYADRHKRRGKLHQVYFRQEAGMTILCDSAGLPIGVLDAPTRLPLTLTSGSSSVRRLHKRTDLPSYDVAAEPLTGGLRSSDNPLIPDLSRVVRERALALQNLEGHNPLQARAPEHRDTLPTPAPSIVEPSADQSNSESASVVPPRAPQPRMQPLPLPPEEVTHSNYRASEAQYEREAGDHLESAPQVPIFPSLSPCNSDTATHLSYADQTLRPVTGISGSRKLVNFPNEGTPALLLEPEPLDLESAEDPQTPNLSPRISTFHDWEAWVDGPKTFSPVSMLPVSGNGSVTPCAFQSEESVVSEQPSKILNVLDAVNATPPHSVVLCSNHVQQPISGVPNNPVQRSIPHTQNIGLSTDLPIILGATDHQRQLVAGPSAYQQGPPAHPPRLRNPRQVAGPHPKGKGKVKYEDGQPQTVPLAKVPLAQTPGLSPPPLTNSKSRETKPIFDLNDPTRRRNVLYNSSIMICGNLLEINNNLDADSWKLQVQYHKFSSHAWQKSREALVEAVTSLAFRIQRLPKTNVPVHFFEEIHSNLQDLYLQMHGILTEKDQLEFNRECAKRLNLQSELIQGLFFSQPFPVAPDPNMLPPPCFSPQSVPGDRCGAHNLTSSYTQAPQQAQVIDEGIHLLVQPTDTTFPISAHTSQSTQLSAFDLLQRPQAASQHLSQVDGHRDLPPVPVSPIFVRDPSWICKHSGGSWLRNYILNGNCEGPFWENDDNDEK